MRIVSAKVSKTGRMIIPAEFRTALGLDRGGDVVIELAGREIRIRTIEEVIAQTQTTARRVAAGNPDASVDAFLAARRRQAKRE